MVSQKLIDELFTGGHSHSLAAFPLRVIFMSKEHQEGQQPVRVLISVPKKRFHHAVDRNRVKRQIREAYRRHKSLIVDQVPPSQMNHRAGRLPAGQGVRMGPKAQPSVSCADETQRRVLGMGITFGI